MKQKTIFHEFSCLGQKGGVGWGGVGERGCAKWENLHFIQAFSNNNPTVRPRALPPLPPRLENTFRVSILGCFASVIDHVPPTSQFIKT
jgi:hypothetical protein